MNKFPFIFILLFVRDSNTDNNLSQLDPASVCCSCPVSDQMTKNQECHWRGVSAHRCRHCHSSFSVRWYYSAPVGCCHQESAVSLCQQYVAVLHTKNTTFYITHTCSSGIGDTWHVFCQQLVIVMTHIENEAGWCVHIIKRFMTIKTYSKIPFSYFQWK